MKFEFAIAAIKGARRYQEDTAMFAPEIGGRAVCVLADGMGGHAGGADASRIACETFLASCRASVDAHSADILMRALEDANRAIARAADRMPENTGMGCTLIGAAFEPQGLTWVSVGDSLLYLWRRNSLAVLNDDHSLAPEIDRLAEAGVISWDEAMSDPRRHYLRSAVTGEDMDLIDSPRDAIAIGPGDVLVLASDGLDALDEATISEIIATGATQSAASIAEALVTRVEVAQLPGQDNTTVLAVRVTQQV